MNNTASADGSCPRLSPNTKMSLRQLSDLIGERGHAIIWAMNYKERQGKLPTCTQIIIGLHTDLGVEISAASAERGLKTIREQDCPPHAT